MSRAQNKRLARLVNDADSEAGTVPDHKCWEAVRRRMNAEGLPGKRGMLLRFQGASAYSSSDMRPPLVGKADPKMVESKSAP